MSNKYNGLTLEAAARMMDACEDSCIATREDDGTYTVEVSDESWCFHHDELKEIVNGE